MQLMLMMLACRGCPEKNSAADAHDTGLSGVLGKNAMLLMLMMLACQGVPGKTQCS